MTFIDEEKFLKKEVNEIINSAQGSEYFINKELKKINCKYTKLKKGFYTFYKVTDLKSKLTIKVRL